MNLLEFYKEQYYKEIERKNEINNSFASPIGVITAIIVAIYYSLTSFDYDIRGAWVPIFFLLLTVCICFLAISLYHLSTGLSKYPEGYDYAFLPRTVELDKYYRDLKEYYKQSGSEDMSDAEFENFLVSELIKCTTINQINNDIKLGHRFYSIRFLILSFIVLCTLAIPYGKSLQVQKEKPNIQKVQLVRQ